VDLRLRFFIRRREVFGHAGRLKAGDLPAVVGDALIDACVAEAAVQRATVICAVHLRERGDDGGMLADEFDLDVGDIKRRDGEGVGAHAVKLLRLGDDLTAGGDAQVVVRQQVIHRVDIIREGSLLPLRLKRFDLVAHGARAAVGPGVQWQSDERHCKPQQKSAH
jgi:hypothetical protein